MPHVIHVGAPSRLVSSLAWAVIFLAPLLALVVPLQGLGWLAALAAGAVAMLVWVSAVALLRRLEWGRRVFVALLLAGLLAHLAGLPLQAWALVQEVAAAGWAGTRLQWALLLATPAACVALWWLLKRLRSDEVRQEFA